MSRQQRRPLPEDLVGFLSPTPEPGERPLRKISALTFLNSVPGLAQQFKTIRPGFWKREIRDGDEIAIVKCPCGERPEIGVLMLTTCACERTYVFGQTYVMVANSPQDRVPQPAD